MIRNLSACLILFLVVFFSLQNVYAQENITPVKNQFIDLNGKFDDYNKVIEEFFKKVEANKIDDAVDFIFLNSEWFAKNPDGKDQMKSDFNKLTTLMGDYVGREKLVEKSLTDHLVYISYMVRYERQPVRYNFKFYKAKDKWQVHLFKYDDHIDQIVEADAFLMLLDMVKKREFIEGK